MRKPSEVFEQKIRPALQDYLSDPLSQRRANALAVAINDHAEWTYKYYDVQRDRSRVFGAASLEEFHQHLFKKCPGKFDKSLKFGENREWVVAHAVHLEPISNPKFPANREKNREICRI